MADETGENTVLQGQVNDPYGVQWNDTGLKAVPEDRRAEFLITVASMVYAGKDDPTPVTFNTAEAIRAVSTAFELPVTRLSEGPYWQTWDGLGPKAKVANLRVVGFETDFRNGTLRVVAVDTGRTVVPIFTKFTAPTGLVLPS